MGIFGSSRKTFVATHVSRVIDDDNVPNSVLQGMANEWKEQSGQLIEQIMEELVAGIGIRAGRMYNFGKNGYVYGRPSGTVHSSFAGKEASEDVLRVLSGGEVSVQYYHFGPLNLLHTGWQQLVDVHGYDANTNQITSLNTPGKPVFLKNMRVIVTNATVDELANGSLDQWGTPPNAGPSPDRKTQTADSGALLQTMSYAVDPAATTDYVLVDTCWEEAGVVKFGSFTIALTGFNVENDTHQVKYIDHTGKVRYWSYIAGTGTHPDIDQVFNAGYSEAGHFFPWTYFRFNKTPEAADKTSIGYKHSKKMADILSLDYDQMHDGIHENPDINDVEQAMMVMAVSIKGESEVEKRYLFDFFDGLYEQQKADPDKFKNTQTYPSSFSILSKLKTELNKSSMIIQDARFKMALNWQNIVRRRVAGTIGPVDTYTVDINPNDTTVSLPSLSGDPIPVVIGNQSHRFRHQVSTGVYEEIIIYSLKLTYHVFEGYDTTADDDDDILLIPVDISVTRSYSLSQREELYARSLHYVMNSRVTIKLKWYQTGLFRAIVIIVMIIITILTKGATMKGLLAAIAAGTITWGVLIMMLVQQLIRQLIYMLLLRLFVKVVGAKIGFLVAVVALVAGTSMGIEAGAAGSPTAVQLLGVASGLNKEVARELQQEFDDLLNERSEFEKYVEEQTKVLESAQDLLNPNARLAPIVVFGESPDEFYQRTVHYGNIGTLGMDAITSFVDVALTLPKLDDTV